MLERHPTTWPVTSHPAGSETDPVTSGILYIVAGQSNAVGQGLIADLPDNLDGTIPGAKIWTGTSWATLEAGVTNEGDNSLEHGPEMSFAQTLLDQGEAGEIFIVKYAVNGSEMYDRWQKGGTAYEGLIDELEAIGYRNFELGGLLFYQGEADTDSDANAAAYQTNYGQFKTDLRNDLDAPNLKIADVQINVGSQAARTATVNTAKSTLAAADSNMFVVKPWRLSSIDATHADSWGQVTIGRDGAFKLLGQTQPFIRSIQRGTFDIADPATSANINLTTPVNPAYTRILFNGATMTLNGDDKSVAARLEFDQSGADGGTIVATIDGAAGASDTVTGSYEVVEYTTEYVNVIQRALIQVTGTSNTATITSVNTSNSVIEQASGFSVTSAVEERRFGHLALTDATTVTATRLVTDATWRPVYQVVEFEDNVIESKQDFSIEIGSGESTDTATITSVSTGDTEVLWRGMTITSSTAWDDFMPYLELTNATTLSAFRDEASTVTTTVYGTALEYVDGFVTAQRGTVTIAASAATGTDTITSVDQDTSYCKWLWFQSGPHGGNESEAHTRVDFTNATTITATRGASSSTPNIASYEVITQA